MASREEAFLDSLYTDSVSGVTYGINRPTKSASNPIWPALASDGSVPDWGVGYSSVRQNGSTTEIYTTCFDGPNVNTVHLGTPETTDGVTITRPSRGQITYGGNTNNNLLTPGGQTRAQYRVAWDEVSGQYVCINYLVTGSSTLTIDIYAAANPKVTGWGSFVKRLPDAHGTGYCEPMAFGRRADGRAFIYTQYFVAAEGIRHVGMLLGPSDGSLTGTWTDVGKILSAPSRAAQFYHSGCWSDGPYVYVPIGRYDDTSGVPAGHTISGTTDRIWKVSLYGGRISDPSALTLLDADWLSSTGVPGVWDGGEILGGNNVAEVGNEWRYYYGGDDDTHHQTPELRRSFGLSTVGKKRIGKISGTGYHIGIPWTATEASSKVTINGSGTLAVELLNITTNVPIPGFTRADCDAISTDTFGQVVTWNGVIAAPKSFKPKIYLTSAQANNLKIEDYGPLDPLTLATSSQWTLSGSDITVQASAGSPTSVQATVVSQNGGTLVFDGVHASRFNASLDGATWASTIAIPAGTTAIYLRFTPQSGDTTVTARVGVPS